MTWGRRLSKAIEAESTLCASLHIAWKSEGANRCGVKETRRNSVKTDKPHKMNANIACHQRRNKAQWHTIAAKLTSLRTLYGIMVLQLRGMANTLHVESKSRTQQPQRLLISRPHGAREHKIPYWILLRLHLPGRARTRDYG